MWREAWEVCGADTEGFKVRKGVSVGGVKPLCIDLFCGLGGWTEGFLAEGYRVVGFDIEVRPYPAQLVIQDVLTIHGSQFKDAAVIVASPPCQKYSYLAMPWSRSVDWVRPDGDGWEVLNSAAAKEMRQKWEREGPDNRLFDACFRIQREAIEATGRDCPACSGLGPRHHGHVCPRCNGTCWLTRYIPLLIENVRGAIPWVGRSAWNFGSFHLWGDVPALMPISPAENEAGTKQAAGNGDWFSKEARDGGASARYGSKSSARKAASAEIAKIPLPLSQHIAAVYYPRNNRKGATAVATPQAETDCRMRVSD